MSVYNEDVATNLENSRNSLRRIARHNDTEFSKQSILNDMEKFVKSVNVMDETVLVPCRLMDLEPRRAGDDDLFRLYAMLNDLKTELLWSRGDCDAQPEPQPQRERPRRPSAASLASAGAEVADSDSETSSAGGDSGVEAEDERQSAARAAAACRRHLRGLRRSLRQLTGAAARLTISYQDDVGAPV